MNETLPITLPQLTSDVVANARKTRLCAYSVALEGWRRGLELKWYTKDTPYFDDMIVFGVNPPGRLFSLSNGERTHFFLRTRGDKVTNEAVIIGSEKDDTKVLLEEKGVPVPKGKGFAPDATDEEVLTYGQELGYPLVLKPTDGSLGLGVVTNIYSVEELAEALVYVRQDLEYDEVIVEQHVAGEEYRFYVVEDEVIAIYNRIPANVTGDGEHTIEELIRFNNLQRRKNARLNSCLIEIDVEIEEFIEAAGYTLDTILPKGKQIYLREKSNVSIGGDPIDVTDEISDEVKQIAIDALKAIPGLYHGGVDIIINEGNVSRDIAVVLEINATAQIGGILFPLRGKARNIPAAIIDYYFPETKGIDTTNSKIYFDMSTVLEPMENRSALEVEVAPAPLGKLYAKKFSVKGNVTSESYHRWLKRQALDLGLHGHVKTAVFDEIEIVVAGTDQQKVKQFKHIIPKYTRGTKVTRIDAEVWNEPVTVGFDILEIYEISRKGSGQHTLRRMEKEQIRLTRLRDRVQKDINHILNSTSWKVTKPLRLIKEKLRDN